VDSIRLAEGRELALLLSSLSVSTEVRLDSVELMETGEAADSTKSFYILQFTLSD
jgi:hypothetical protein